LDAAGGDLADAHFRSVRLAQGCEALVQGAASRRTERAAAAIGDRARMRSALGALAGVGEAGSTGRMRAGLDVVGEDPALGY